MWPEHEAHCGRNEVSNCLFNNILDTASSGINETDLLSDKCPEMNRNKFVVFCLSNYRKQFVLKRNTQHLFLKKDTQNRNDRVHATERKQKTRG